MTLSNFDWTDKNSLKWFIMLPTGHEGPYSLEDLGSRFAKKRIGPETLVWAEGLASPLPLREVFLRSSDEDTDSARDEVPPPLPPLPEEDLPPLPQEAQRDEDEGEVETPAPPKQKRKFPVFLVLLLVLLGIGAFFGFQWLKSQEKFSIRRYPKMSPEVHQRIVNSLDFKGWGSKIFFKEFVPADLSHIWLVTSSYQTCDVSARFASTPGKLLAMNDAEVVFTTKGKLVDHVVQFSEFQFEQGSKIIPGMYQMNLTASDCEWDGIVPRIANHFKAPEKSYQAQTNVVLFEKGAAEFNQILDQVNQKKMEKELKARHQRDQFWDDLQQKLQTLLAIGLQIEQMLIDFVEGNPKTFSTRLKPAINDYTTKYGHFLTNFVSANETYFQQISQGELRELTLRKNYEEIIRLTGKDVGLTAMKTIEELQKMKSPTRSQLNEMKKKITQLFGRLKNKINEKIIEVTEDRASSP